MDRQLRMEPELSHKKLANGRLDAKRAWMPEIELPLQAQTLEMLMADNRRLKFPPNRDWFQCRAALTESYMRRFDQAGSPFPGERDKNARSEINQDNGDRLAQAALSHWHSQYDFRSHVDLIDAQAFAYGFGAGRLKKVKRRILGYDARGNSPDQRIPVLIPRDTKRVYLDDSQHALMHEGFALGPNIIQTRTMKLADLKAAAKAGGTDPKKEEGGYIPSEINSLKGDRNGNVELVELEGDLVIETSTDTIIEQDVVVTAAIGDGTHSLVRVREGEKFSTYLIHQYHMEGPATTATSPLIKGMPVAMAAAQALNRVIESGLLKTSPPIGYPKDDVAFANRGGPVVEPYAQWPTIEDLNVYSEVGGEPEQLFQIFAGLVQMYSDVTGVNPPRLGAQTKSHTTAFAKDAELTQGAIRTVDYARSTLEGPMTRFLELEYRMGLSEFRGSQTIFVEAWNEFVEIRKDHLPDIVKFRAIGAGAPAEDQARNAQRLASAQTALQIDSLAVQLGRPPKIEHGNLIEQVLSEGGWTDVSAITRPEDAAEGAATQSDVGGPIGARGVITQPSPAVEALG